LSVDEMILTKILSCECDVKITNHIQNVDSMKAVVIYRSDFICHISVYCTNISVNVVQDGYLSGQEMIDKYDLFVGSQATDFGNVLRHQEL